jgi:hypothetical protein
MDPIWIFLILFAVIILIFIILLGLTNNSTGTTGTSGVTGIPNVQTIPIYTIDYWGGATGVTGVTGASSACSVYTFQGEIQDIDALYRAVPFTPSVNTNIIMSCLPFTDIGTTGLQCYGPQAIGNNTCLDPDQMAAQEQMHTCIGNTGTNGLGCRDYDGTVYNVGDTVDFFTPCQLKPCTTTLASIALNYLANPNLNITYLNMKCIYPTITFSGSTGATGATGSTGATGATGATGISSVIINAGTCDFSYNQQWRIQRANLNATGTGFVNSATGSYAYILNRQTNLCLVVGNSNNLTLSKCGSGTYPWLLTSGFQIGDITPPDQIVWVGNAIIPLTTSGDFLNFLNSSNPQSITLFSSVFGYDVSMKNFQLSLNAGSSGYFANANYLDYTLFNFILENASDYPL